MLVPGQYVTPCREWAMWSIQIQNSGGNQSADAGVSSSDDDQCIH